MNIEFRRGLLPLYTKSNSKGYFLCFNEPITFVSSDFLHDFMYSSTTTVVVIY